MARGASSARKDTITRTKVSTGANTGGVSTSKTPYWNKAKVKDLLNQGAKIAGTVADANVRANTGGVNTSNVNAWHPETTESGKVNDEFKNTDPTKVY